MVATNAGGTRVVRHGTMRRHVAGVEAVLGDGSTISHLQGLGKDNTGYDLAGLLTGSEGTLGVITAVRLGLVPVLAERAVVGLAFAQVADAVAAVPLVRGACPAVDAIELVLAPGISLVGSVLGVSVPERLRAPAVLLVELAADHDPLEGLDTIIEHLGLADEPVVATEPAARGRLWAIRERHSEAVNLLGPPLKLDVTVPLAETVGFLAEVDGLVPPGAQAVVFGHLGDGNLHVNVVGVEPGCVEDVEGAVLSAAARRGGSISAEHGIGTAKVRYLHLVRSPAERAAFAAIKHALDPAGILNPAVLLGSSEGAP
jgi:FAD/FMN-containing dehydrogenase